MVEIDIEVDPEIAEAAGVSGTPTIQFFKDKQLRLKLPGVKQKREYREIIESNLAWEKMSEIRVYVLLLLLFVSAL